MDLGEFAIGRDAIQVTSGKNDGIVWFRRTEEEGSGDDVEE
jgi:hypothetical protein